MMLHSQNMSLTTIENFSKALKSKSVIRRRRVENPPKIGSKIGQKKVIFFIFSAISGVSVQGLEFHWKAQKLNKITVFTRKNCKFSVFCRKYGSKGSQMSRESQQTTKHVQIDQKPKPYANKSILRRYLAIFSKIKFSSILATIFLQKKCEF